MTDYMHRSVYNYGSFGKNKAAFGEVGISVHSEKKVNTSLSLIVLATSPIIVKVIPATRTQ